jgi:hypothetical protein
VTSLLHSSDNLKVYHKNISELPSNYKALQPRRSYPSEKIHLTSDIICLILWIQLHILPSNYLQLKTSHRLFNDVISLRLWIFAYYYSNIGNVRCDSLLTVLQNWLLSPPQEGVKTAVILTSPLHKLSQTVKFLVSISYACVFLMC